MQRRPGLHFGAAKQNPERILIQAYFILTTNHCLRYVKFLIIEGKTVCLKMIENNYLQEEILNGNNRV